MATRFHLPDGGAVDLVAMTLDAFFVRNIDQFMEFTVAAAPMPAKRESPWCKILNMLQLKPPMPDPPQDQTYDNAEGLLKFAKTHRYSGYSIFQVGSIGAPVSYARVAYHAVNTFVVVAPDGRRRHVRFHWVPVAGVLKINPTKLHKSEYLHEELRKRLVKWPARFMLNMQIGETGDALHDPTRPWPKRRINIELGTLTLTGVPDDSETIAEKIAFNPCRLVPGIEVSADPILQARRGAYETSREMRGGTACPFHTEAK
jgi:catalase